MTAPPATESLWMTTSEATGFPGLDRDLGVDVAGVAEVHEGSPCRVRTLAGRRVTARDVVIATNYPVLDRGLFFTRMEAARSYCVAGRVRGSQPDGMLITAGSPTRSVRGYHDG